MEEQKQKRKFLGVYFDCCHVYGRMYQNKEGTHYIGRCPRCLRYIHAKVGTDGTSQRFFRAR